MTNLDPLKSVVSTKDKSLQGSKPLTRSSHLIAMVMMQMVRAVLRTNNNIESSAFQVNLAAWAPKN